MPVNEVRGTRSLETTEAHIENLKKQLNRSEARQAETLRKVATGEKVIEGYKAEIAKYEAEAEEKAADIAKQFEKADAYAAKIIAKRNKKKAEGMQAATKATKRNSKEFIEGQRVASHRVWHLSGKATPKSTCSYCVEEGLIAPKAVKTKEPAPVKVDKRRSPRSTEHLESQRAAAHKHWHVSGKSGPNSTCSYCVEEGLIEPWKEKDGGKGAYAMHNRWHVGRGITKTDCGYCNGTKEYSK
jgi:hypothetical protein